MKLYILHGWTYKPEPWLEVIKDLKAQGIEAELLRVQVSANRQRKSTLSKNTLNGQKSSCQRAVSRLATATAAASF